MIGILASPRSRGRFERKILENWINIGSHSACLERSYIEKCVGRGTENIDIICWVVGGVTIEWKRKKKYKQGGVWLKKKPQMMDGIVTMSEFIIEAHPIIWYGVAASNI